MSPITIELGNLRANELAALHSITRGMDRRAVEITLEHIIGRAHAQALNDDADRLIYDVLAGIDAKLDSA